MATTDCDSVVTISDDPLPHALPSRRNGGVGAVPVQLPAEFAPAQQAQMARVPLAGEVNQGQQTACVFGCYRGYCGAGNTPAQQAYQRGIQRDVHAAGGDHDSQAQLRLTGSDEQLLECILQDEERQ